MKNSPEAVTMLDLILCLSHAMDLISFRVNNHHRRVAYIASAIADEMGLAPELQADIVMAAAVHDVGALSLQDRLDTLEFELTEPHLHARRGAFLLHPFGPFNAAAELIRFHHVRWDAGRGAEEEGEEVPIGSHIIHLADRVDVLLRPQQPILQQAPDIINAIQRESEGMFRADLVEVLRSIASREFFWFDLGMPSHRQALHSRLGDRAVNIGLEEMKEISEVFARIIDFRSRFTMIHSTGVAVIAEDLARRAGFSADDTSRMRIAGQLHDLGKLAVPTEILEKPAGLNESEFNVVKSHTFHTCRILEALPQFETITRWAAFHHERPDGSGYPFHIAGTDIDTGCRIMTVADVFTAVTEQRPYRNGMNEVDALNVLDVMARKRSVDVDLVNLVRENFDELNEMRREAQEWAAYEYARFAQV